MVTLTGDVLRVTYEREETSFRVIKVQVERDLISVVGVFQAVGPGTRVRATGEFVIDAKHGKQFQAATLVPLDPDTAAGIERYLASGLIRGVGPSFARRIVKAFGAETLTILDQNPDRLQQVPGLGERRVEEIKRSWLAQRALSSLMILLKPYGGSPALATRIRERYGDRAESVVQTSPYRLALEVRGIGFQTADRIARAAGISHDHPERAQAGVLHVLEEITDQGHVYWQRQDLEQRTAERLGIDVAHVESALSVLWASGRIVIEQDRVFPASLAAAELSAAQLLERLLESPGHVLHHVDRSIGAFEARAGVTLSIGQREAVEMAARHKVVVITGGPGVGKTTLVLAILDVFERSRLTVRLAAPTGRAAKRLSEATEHEATTLHRLLEYEPSRGRGAQAFQRNAGRPIEAQALVVDEASMIDLPLAEALLQALPSAGRLVIVGDADQLPSVGPGAFLRDLIESRVIPVVRLNRIFRQSGASGIVENAHRILQGEEPAGGQIDSPGADFFVIARSNPEEAQATILELVTRRIPGRFGYDRRDEIQILCPMHRGAAGTQALNTSLQAALNPISPGLLRRGTTFRSGDKVLQTKNDYDKDVYNGDMGLIERVDPEARRVTVRFDERSVVYEDAELDTLILAYAISIHKSQGSEYPAVVIPLLTSHFVMLSRNLLYTAVTRARKLCVLVADPKAIRLALAETRREDRRTWLAARLEAGARRAIS